MTPEPYVCPAGHASYADNENRYCPVCAAFEDDDPKLVQALIDQTLDGHWGVAILPRPQLLRALRILQHRLALDAREQAAEAWSPWRMPYPQPLPEEPVGG
jgi:hypothetical protein